MLLLEGAAGVDKATPLYELRLMGQVKLRNVALDAQKCASKGIDGKQGGVLKPLHPQQQSGHHVTWLQKCVARHQGASGP